MTFEILFNTVAKWWYLARVSFLVVVFQDFIWKLYLLNIPVDFQTQVFMIINQHETLH